MNIMVEIILFLRHDLKLPWPAGGLRKIAIYILPEWFVSDLNGNPEDQFSRVKAHM